MPDNSPRRFPSNLGALAWATIIFSLPVFVTAGLFVLMEQADVMTAAGASAVAIAGLAVVAWLHVTEVRAVDSYLRGLIDQAESPDLLHLVADKPGGLKQVPELSNWGLGRVARLGRQLADRYRRRIRSLATERERLQAVAETIADPLILIGLDRKVSLENRAARQRFGHTLMERDLADGMRDPDVLAAADSVLAGGEAQTIVLDSVTPAARVYEVRIAPFPREPTAERDGALLSLHDITAIVRSEQMRADFVANASHELRNPLSILSGCIETLQGAAQGDAAASERFLKIMNAQADRMSRLTNDLLSLSLIEIDELTPPSGTVMLERVIGTVVDFLKLKAQDREMTIEVDCPDLPDIVGDPNQIEQVLTNLIDNAIKYGAPKTEVAVSVRLRARDDQIKGPVVDISVTDQGEGIAREHLPRLTERFYRVDTARSRAMGGTGLGLAIVKHIVARHHGRLAVRSVQQGEIGERGSTFTAILPIDLREI